MNRTGRALTLGCLLLLQPLLALAEGGNSLLIPATGRCTFDTQPEDLQNALKACERTAESGDAQAQYELGEFYYSGNQAPKDLKKAVNWFEKASLQGQAQAQYRLGSMFFHGEGVPANNVQAYILLKMAAVNGDEDALTWPTKSPSRCPRRTRTRYPGARPDFPQIPAGAAKRRRAHTLLPCPDGPTYFSGIGIGNGITLPPPLASLIFAVPNRSTSSIRTINASARNCAPHLRTAP